MACLIAQIAFKLSKIKKYYEKDNTLNVQFKLFEFYLLLHSLCNTFQLYEMMRVLLGKKEMSYTWPVQRKDAFIDLKIKYSNHIS